MEMLEPRRKQILVHPGLQVVMIVKTQLYAWFPTKPTRPTWPSNDHERHLLFPTGIARSKKGMRILSCLRLDGARLFLDKVHSSGRRKKRPNLPAFQTSLGWYDLISVSIAGSCASMAESSALMDSLWIFLNDKPYLNLKLDIHTSENFSDSFWSTSRCFSHPRAAFLCSALS